MPREQGMIDEAVAEVISATDSGKGGKAAKETDELFFARLCSFASRREIVALRVRPVSRWEWM
jgi:hypothetical protein